MFARVVFLLIALFWVIMNALLWRAEYGNHNVFGAAVPAEIVWRKILTAPDSSSLGIYQRGKKIGFCHWVTGVGEEFSSLDEAPPGGMTARPGGYRIRLDGSLSPGEMEGRVRFDGNLTLSTHRAWKEFNLHLNLRPMVWEVHSVAAEQTVRVRAQDGEGRFERVLRFADLQNPQALLREFAGPWSLVLLGGLDLPASSSGQSPPALNIIWEARYDTLKIGREPVRVYRLETRLLDRFPVRFFVSRAGEILRAELPDGIILAHDQLKPF